MLRNIRHFSATLLLCVGNIIFSANTSFAGEESYPVPIQFAIPQKTVADALILFAEQSGEQIIFSYDDAQNIPARQLTGTYRPIEALVEILKNTGLKAYRNQDGTIVVRKDLDFKPVSPSKPRILELEKGRKKSAVGTVVAHEKEVQQPEELVITGSRIKREELSAPNLVSIIKSDTILRSGTSNIEELLNQLPQISPSLTGKSNNPGNGIATVDLRRLGAQRTLVLLNGRRYVSSDPSGIVDLNTIPTFLLEKIEVATGGTSAVYGSDAIAGVVNFKLRDDFDGFEGLARYRVSDQGDAGKFDVNLVYGKSFNDDRGHAFLHLGFLERKPLLQRERNFSAYALADSYIKEGTTDPKLGFGEYLSKENGGVPGLIQIGSVAIPGGRVFGMPENGPHPGIMRFGPNGEALDYSPFTDSFNFAPYNFLQLPQKRLMATFGGAYRVTEKVEIYNQIIFSQNKVDLELAPAPLRVSDLEVPIENPFLHASSQDALRGIDWYSTGEIWQVRNAGGNLLYDSQGAPIQARQALGGEDGITPLWAADGSPVAMVGAASSDTAGKLLYIADGRATIPGFYRRLLELGPRQVKNNRRALNVVLGLRGEITPNWEFYAHYNYNDYNNTLHEINDVSIEKFRHSVNIVASDDGFICRDETAREEGCVPANIFGEGNISQDALDYFILKNLDSANYTRQDASFHMAGTLDNNIGDGIKVLFGGDWRKENGSFYGDESNLADLGGGFSSRSKIHGQYNVWSLFGELKAPLVEGKPLLEKLELSTALRYSDYSVSGSVWSVASGFNWQPHSDVRVRGQFQHAVREPNISNLFTQEDYSYPIISDPCSQENIASYGNIEDICIASGIASNQIGSFSQIDKQIKETYSGNINLEAESSNTFTLGLIYQPSFLPELQVTFDYYNITLKNQIAPYAGGAMGIIESCFREENSIAESCDRIIRNDEGQISTINSSQSNSGYTNTLGIDGQIFFQKPLENGLFGSGERILLNFQGSYLFKYLYRNLEGEAGFDCAGYFAGLCGEPLPNFRFVQSSTWQNDRVEVSLRWRHFGKVTNKYSVSEDVAVPKLAAKNYFDLYLQYRLEDNLILRSGVDNIFNNSPDFVGNGQQQANTFPSIYDVLGQYFHFSINVYY